MFSRDSASACLVSVIVLALGGCSAPGLGMESPLPIANDRLLSKTKGQFQNRTPSVRFAAGNSITEL
jgi:hypothetical protein